MARVYPCDYCNEEPAAFNVGNLATGEQRTVGIVCLPQLCQEMLDLAGVVMLHMQREQDEPAEPAEDTRGAAPAAPRPRRRRNVAVHHEGDRPAVAAEGTDQEAADGA